MYGDECACPYDCINCYGGANSHQTPAPGEPEGWHYCVCTEGRQGVDCRECVDGGCPGKDNRLVFFSSCACQKFFVQT